MVNLTKYLDEEDGELDISGNALQIAGFNLDEDQKWMMDEAEGTEFVVKKAADFKDVKQRPNYINAMLVQSRGELMVGCGNCWDEPKDPEGKSKLAKKPDEALRGPFVACVRWQGNMHNACGNCIWSGNANTCTFYRANKQARAEQRRVQYEKQGKDEERDKRLRDREKKKLAKEKPKNPEIRDEEEFYDAEE